ALLARASASTVSTGQPDRRIRMIARKSTGGRPPRGSIARPPPEDPTAAISRLQLSDGSFQLGGVIGQLVLDESLTWDHFVTTVPTSIGSHLYGDEIWAAALAMAYLTVKAADKRDVWNGLWEKANEYAAQALQGSTISFDLLVNDAVRLF
ncbi:hypothetical protein FOMPIDRAFT_1023065, partial [Fomitopsis schrenkii]